jgi:hypothetical protein
MGWFKEGPLHLARWQQRLAPPDACEVEHAAHASGVVHCGEHDGGRGQLLRAFGVFVRFVWGSPTPQSQTRSPQLCCRKF